MRRRVLIASFLVPIVSAAAEDRPISGQKLVIKRSASGREKIAFVSKDPAALFPGIGGADDPSAGGALVEVFAQGGGFAGTAYLPMPAGAQWLPKAGTPPSYKYVNKLAPAGPSGVRSATLKQGKVLKLVTKSAPLALAAPLGSVGIRITTGSLRNCARFDATTVRKDVPGNFVARGALAASLPDCSDGQLASVPCYDGPGGVCGGLCPGDAECVPGPTDECICVSPSAPCGDTHPVCGGVCPAGETCTGGLPGGCGCIPVGESPCGHAGMPTCGGGWCPGGLVCRASLTAMGGQVSEGCLCSTAGPCGAGGRDCPAGFVCAASEFEVRCLPTTCAGVDVTYPTCGGTCPDGLACIPYDSALDGQLCICADGGASCGSACGGFVCPGGQVCTDDGSGCGCAP